MEEINGKKTDFDFWPPGEAQTYRDADEIVLKEDKAVGPITETQVLQDGKTRTIVTWKVPLHDERRKAVRILGIYQDVTDRLEAAQQKGYETLLAKIAHKLRGRALLYQESLIRLGRDHPNLGDDPTFQHADKAARYLAASMVQAGRVTLLDRAKTRPFPVWAKTQELSTVFDDPRIGLDARAGVEAVILKGYVENFQEAVLALLSNARRHVAALEDGGRILVIGHADEDSIHISVVDNGVGVPEEIKDRILEIGFTTSKDGLGIGLPLVKIFCESCGGRLSWTKGLEESGACFTISLPRWNK